MDTRGDGSWKREREKQVAIKTEKKRDRHIENVRGEVEIKESDEQGLKHSNWKLTLCQRFQSNHFPNPRHLLGTLYSSLLFSYSLSPFSVPNPTEPKMTSAMARASTSTFITITFTHMCTHITHTITHMHTISHAHNLTHTPTHTQLHTQPHSSISHTITHTPSHPPHTFHRWANTEEGTEEGKPGMEGFGAGPLPLPLLTAFSLRGPGNTSLFFFPPSPLIFLTPGGNKPLPLKHHKHSPKREEKHLEKLRGGVLQAFLLLKMGLTQRGIVLHQLHLGKHLNCF